MQFAILKVMTFATAKSSTDPIKKLVDVIGQGGTVFIVDAGLISPLEREQIERAVTTHTKLTPSAPTENAPHQKTHPFFQALSPDRLRLLERLSSKAQGSGSPEQPPDLPRPAYAQLFEACLAEMGILTDSQTAPWACWQALADGLSVDPSQHWMALEPCQWGVSTQQVTMRTCQPYPCLGSELLAALEAGLDRLNAQLHLSPSGRAYFGFEKPFDLNTAWPESMEGLAADDFLPTGQQARAWRQFITEVEMTLALQPELGNIQSLWPWGMGSPVYERTMDGPARKEHAMREGPRTLGLPLVLAGFQHWMSNHGHPFKLEWRSFKGIQTVDDWLNQWERVLEDLEGLQILPMRHEEPGDRPWALILQQYWAYKVVCQSDLHSNSRGSASSPSFFNRLRRFTKSLFSGQRSRLADKPAHAYLLDLACWQEQAAAPGGFGGP